MQTSIFDSIVRPTLLLDETKAMRNLQRMAAKARAQNVRFRPHFKTHQSAEIGEWFRQQGVEAITVSSVDMAVYFAAHGWKDITIAFPVNLRQMNELRTLAGQVHLGLLVESVESVHALEDGLKENVDIWIKIDCGSLRTGILYTQTAAIQAIAAEVQSCSSLHLRGLLTHAGHTYQAGSPARVVEVYTEAVERMNQVRDQLQAAGFSALEISVGDTPGCSLSPSFGSVDEIRPGNFIFFDAEQFRFGSCQFEDVAVALTCPVVALHPERETVIVYGGAIHLSKDTWKENNIPSYGLVALPNKQGWGEPIPGAYVYSLSQEHGLVHIPTSAMTQIQVGDLLCILPAHSCLTIQAMQKYLTLDGRWVDTLLT